MLNEKDNNSADKLAFLASQHPTAPPTPTSQEGTPAVQVLLVSTNKCRDFD